MLNLNPVYSFGNKIELSQPEFVSDDFDIVTNAIVPTSVIKEHVIVQNTADDTLLADTVKEAAKFVEKLIPGPRILFLATYDIFASDWWNGKLYIPFAPLYGVTSIYYYDSTNSLVELDSSNYEVRKPQDTCGTVEFFPDITFPVIYNRSLPIRVRFQSGYPTVSAIPLPLIRAVKLIAGHWYKNRNAAAEKSIKEIEFSVNSIVNAFDTGAY